MNVPVQPFLPWKISISLLHIIASCTALLRVHHRRKTRRLWWDDYAALVPALTEFLNAVLLWVRLRKFSDEEDIRLREMKVNLAILNADLLSTTMWWSRLSMSLAIMRIIPEWSKLRIITIIASSAFILNWLALIISYTTICLLSKTWQHGTADVLICGPAGMTAVSGIVLDIIADIYLAALPLYKLWRLNLPTAQRRLVRLVFSTSLLTLIAALLVLVASYGNIIKGSGKGLVWIMIVQIEEAISVIANNLTVLISWGYKAFRGDIDVDAESNTFIKPHWTCSPDSDIESEITSSNSTGASNNLNHKSTHVISVRVAPG